MKRIEGGGKIKQHPRKKRSARKGSRSRSRDGGGRGVNNLKECRFERKRSHSSKLKRTKRMPGEISYTYRSSIQRANGKEKRSGRITAIKSGKGGISDILRSNEKCGVLSVYCDI